MTNTADKTDSKNSMDTRREALDQAIRSGCLPDQAVDTASKFEAYLLGTKGEIAALEAEIKALREENEALLAHAAAMSKSRAASDGVVFVQEKHVHDDTCQFDWRRGEQFKPGDTIEDENYFWENDSTGGLEHVSGKFLFAGGLTYKYYRAEKKYLCGK